MIVWYWISSGIRTARKWQFNYELVTLINSKRFWRWCVILRTNCLLDFVHRPDKILDYNIKSRRFGSWFVFRLQVMGGETPTQMDPSRPIWVGVFPPITWRRKTNQLPKRRDFILYSSIVSGRWTKSRRQLVLVTVMLIQLLLPFKHLRLSNLIMHVSSR
jgi:hypothetical protein